MLYLLLVFLTAISFLLWLLYFIIAVIIHKQMPELPKYPSKKSSKTQPLVSVVIPARNEEHRIKKCIESLKSQTYPELEIIVVDDYSTDNTIEVVKNAVGNDKRFEILDLKHIKKEKPSGWMGKTYALQQGSKLAKGELLLFIDADISLPSQIIERSVDYAIKNKIDLLSLMPQNTCETFWEKVIQPVPADMLILPLWKVNDPKSKVAIAFGFFMLLKHSTFKKVDGYETIKGQLADDARMAKLIKSSGFRIGLIKAQSMMKLRMYEGFSELWEGWGKHVLGIIKNPQFRTKATKTLVVFTYLFGIFEAFVLPFLAMIITFMLGMILLVPHWNYLFLFSLTTWLFSMIPQFYVMKQFHIGDAKYAPLTFLGGIVIIGTILSSAFKVSFRKGVTWKGRPYQHKDTR